MTGTEKAELLAKLDELRDAIPVRSTYPQDTQHFTLLHEVREMVEGLREGQAQ